MHMGMFERSRRGTWDGGGWEEEEVRKREMEEGKGRGEEEREQACE